MGNSLGRIFFSAACAGATVLAVVYPGWASETRSQAYGGYVDLALQSLGWPDQPVAGSMLSVPLRVTNLGPQTADVPQVVFSADSTLRLSHSTGCAGSPSSSPQCVLGAPLAPGESRELAYFGWLHPAARGQLTMGAYALSEAIDVQPGNEMVVAAMPIRAEVDLVVELLDEHPEVLQDGRLRWRFELRNAGPSDALAFWPNFLLSPSEGAEESCESLDANSNCPGGNGGAVIAAGGSLRYTATMAPLSASSPAIWIWLSAYPQESELNFADNHASVDFADPLFIDEFED